MINTISGFIVDVVRAGYRRRSWLSGVALVLTLVVGVAYLLIGALRVNPFDTTYQVRVRLPDSGGLLSNQDVSVRGVPVGRIESLHLVPDGVEAVTNIKSKTRIPAASKVNVSGLSAAGEQYIDFLPDATTGPYLSDGSVVGQDQATVPIPLSKMLADTNGVLAQTDTTKLETIKAELSLSHEGPQKLSDIVEGGTFLLSTLDPVLPQTVNLLKNSRIVLTTLTDKNTGLAVATRNVSQFMAAAQQMDGGYRRLVDQTPQTLSSVDTVFDDNSDTMVGLLANLASTSQLLYIRVPALNALFPKYRGSGLDALASVMHDHGLWASADIYPRYICDYGTSRGVVSTAEAPEPFMWTGYCRDDDPSVLIRGAKNAPRPAGDDTAGPPPGADLGQQTDPTPRGRYTIPTPYGGPTLPIEPPH